MEPENEADLYENLRREQARLKTFTNWPVTHVSSEDLAANGLYYIGGGTCQCVFCGGCFHDWKTNDTVRGAHKRLYPMCPFLKGEMVGNIPRSAQSNPTSKRYSNPHIGSSYDQGVSSRNNDYSNLEHRLETFSNWSEENAQAPRDLAEAGFIYCGTDDRVKCFQCEGEFEIFELHDDPWKLHASRFPYCNYVYLCKGQAYINKVKRLSFHYTAQCRFTSRKLEKQHSDMPPDKQWDENLILMTKCQENQNAGAKRQENIHERNINLGLGASSKEQSNVSADQRECQGFIAQIKMPSDFASGKPKYGDSPSSKYQIYNRYLASKKQGHATSKVEAFNQIYSDLAPKKQENRHATSKGETFNEFISMTGACTDSVLSSQPKFGAGKDKLHKISQNERDFRSKIIRQATFSKSADNLLQEDIVYTGKVEQEEQKPNKAMAFTPSKQASAAPSLATYGLHKTPDKPSQKAGKPTYGDSTSSTDQIYSDLASKKQGDRHATLKVEAFNQIYSDLAPKKQENRHATSEGETFNEFISVTGACTDSPLSRQPKFGASKGKVNMISQNERDFRSKIIRQATFSKSTDNLLQEDIVYTGKVEQEEQKPNKGMAFTPSKQASATPSPASYGLHKPPDKPSQNDDLKKMEIERRLREVLELVSDFGVDGKAKVQNDSNCVGRPTPQDKIASSPASLQSKCSACEFGPSTSSAKAPLGTAKMKEVSPLKSDYSKPKIPAYGVVPKQKKDSPGPTLGKNIIPSTSACNTRRTTKAPRPDTSMCKICTAEEMDTVFLPCKHMVACSKCSELMDLCPICRAPIVSIFRPILS